MSYQDSPDVDEVAEMQRAVRELQWLRGAVEELCDKWEDGVSPEASSAADEFRALLTRGAQ